MLAQCLYVLTDDNPPAATEVRSNGSYISCLLSILQDARAVTIEAVPQGLVGQRLLTLNVLAAGQ